MKLNEILMNMLIILFVILVLMNIWQVKQIRLLQEINTIQSSKIETLAENAQFQIDFLKETKVNYSDMEEFNSMVKHLNEIIGTFEVIK